MPLLANESNASGKSSEISKKKKRERESFKNQRIFSSKTEQCV